MTKGIVLSLYDFTGEALKPWAEAGYLCYAFDIQHKDTVVEGYANGGFTRYCGIDLWNIDNIAALQEQFKNENVVFGIAFPVCTDLAVSGAAHFARLAIDCIHKEYPNKLNQVLQSDEFLLSPTALHPAFYGCFDWHSSVHGHWLLVRLLRTATDTLPMEMQEEIAAALEVNVGTVKTQLHRAVHRLREELGAYR